jgi:aspartate kinase
VVGRVMAAMSQSDIEILQSADSHSTITLLLHRGDMEKAVSALHKQFHLAEEVSSR